MNKRSIELLLLIVFAFTSVVAVAENSDVRVVADQPAAEKESAAAKPILLFFLNPNGRPCQMQSQILKQNQADIEKHAQIQGISATVQSHRQYFYQFGVRRLPSLLLIEPTGKVLHRFSPGIHQRAEILAVISRQGTP